ncbi:unnamed protein product [Orchesella dallaii]|uniref:Uncharacterized protein n=1 Tax=Orchesella dallaii TaxID=48710 RepID=A0ABP1Q183_9HEXA
MVAVQMACHHLQKGECPVAIAAGTNVLLQMDPKTKVVWADDGICKTFDASANGYGRGEGVGVLIMKRYSDALRDGDRIHGLILGSASSQEGLSKSFGAPTIENETRTMVNALKSAQIDPNDVDYVEAHATGTGVGDPVEAEALVRAYSSQQKRIAPLLIGSVKTNIGHTESCSGIAAIMKVLLAMKHESIPPHINVKTINPKVNFSTIPGKITLEMEEWKRSSTRPRIAGVSNFGITGTDVHMILQEPPQISSELEMFPQNNTTKSAFHILALSAKTTSALDQLSEAFISFLGKETDEEQSLKDIAFTTNACRPHHPFRKSVFGRNKEELILQLNRSSCFPMNKSKTDLVVGFIFNDKVTPSQLPNYRVLYSSFPLFKMQMDFCDTLCQQVTSFSPLSCLLNTNNKIPDSMFSTKEWQLCSFSLTYSLYKLWESWGVKGSYVLGINFSNTIIKIESVVRGLQEANLKQIFNLVINNTAPIESSSSPQLQPPRVGFVSCVNGEEMSCSSPSAALSELSTHGCNVFIEVGVEKIFDVWDDSIIPSSESKPLFLHAGVELLDGSLKGNGLTTIYSTLSTLYNAGYPIDWEGFYKYNSCSKVSLPHYPFQRKSIWFKGGKREGVSTHVPFPLQLESQLLHPLLGNYVSSLSTTPTTAQAQQRVLFENLLIAEHQAPYLTDHAFGSDVIFPGAGFLELAVAATCFKNGKSPYIIENFQVHQPLHISKFEGCSIKTTVENVMKITVEARQGGMEQAQPTVWKQHASATGSSSAIPELELMETQHDVNGIKIRCTEDQHGPANFYTGIGKFGLSFGERFQTLRRIYKRDGELLADVSIPPDAAHYICHPLLSDVMLQSYMILKNPALEALHVPISIQKFVCHRRVSPQECSSREGLNFHVYCDEKEDTVYLLDAQGRSVATMISPRLKVTTVDAMLTAAGIQASRSNSGPENDFTGPIDTYEVVWKPATSFQMEGSLKIPIDSTGFTKLPSYHNLLKSLEFRNKFTSGEKLIFENVNRLCELYILKALLDMGWKPHLGKTIRLDELVKEFNITAVFIPAFRHYLSYLVKQGVLVEQGNSNYIIKTLPDKKEVVEDSIDKLLTGLSTYGPIHSLHCCGSQLASILQGRVKGQQILFEEGESGLTPAEQIYKTNLYYRSSANAAPQIFFEVARHLWNSTNTPMLPRKLRILEVGGGTGVFTKDALRMLSEDDIDYTYYFTDISTSFLKKAEAKFPFQQANSNIIYETFNIERSPLEQGLPPAYFDIVVGLDVLHVTKELQNALANIHSVLKPGGHLIIGETCKPIPEADLSFGILDGYWRFIDHDIRPSHCTISADGWLSLLQESGFAGPSSKALLANNHMCVVVGTKSHPEETHKHNAAISTKMWLLLHDLDNKPEVIDGIVKRMMNLGRSLVPCCISEGVQNLSPRLKGRTADFEGVLCMFEGKDSFASTNCRAILDPLLLVSKFLIEKGGSRRLCVATFGLSTACKDTVVGNPSSATALGFLRCVKLEVPSLISKLVDLDPNENEREKMLDILVQELWMGDDETELSYRNGVRYNRRLIATTPITTQDFMPIPPKVQNYSVELPRSNLLTDLLYLPKTEDVATEQNQVVVEVRAASLNFKDVLNVMKPSEEFKKMSTIGIDFSGIVSSVGVNVKGVQVGTPVFGVSWDHSTFCRYLPSSLENLTVIPDGISFEEASTIPVTFLTAWYCLVNIAKAARGQTVLIHAASGGVGLIAIQISKLLGLKIVATAGSEKKRAFLANLGIPHVHNSRSLEYGQKIKEITNGEGVDIVLNCLTGPGFKETSLEITKNGGHFVEISKLDIWSEKEVKERNPGVNYTIVDLTVVDRKMLRSILTHLGTLIEQGSIKPLPFTRFTASKLITALKFLQKAKHIGKVVIKMPQFDLQREVFRDLLFNDRSTYLITGGKGAIGLAITEWMVSHGAKHLVLMGRKPPKQKVLERVAKLVEETGANIIFKEADAADFHQCQQVINEISEDSKLPPLRGIHHCAGVLSDRTIMNQDWDNFDYVLTPKIQGAYNLHTLTQALSLEFFVLHSSMSATFGNFGQSNYCSANTYMEALIAKRDWMGLQGMVVNWGQWNAGLAENLELELFYPFTEAQGLAALEAFFFENRVAAVAGFMKFNEIIIRVPAFQKTLLKVLSLEKQGVVSGVESVCRDDKQSLPDAYFKSEEKEEKEKLVRDFVKEQISETLGILTNEVEEDVKFSSMGLDSLLSIEFYNKLQSEMGDIHLDYIDMEEQGTVNQVSDLILARLEEYGK